MNYFTIGEVAEEMTKTCHNGSSWSGPDRKEFHRKIKTYIDNCLIALGSNLKAFNNIQKVDLKISEDLKEHIIDTYIIGNGRFPNQAELSYSISRNAFGYETVSENVVFVTKQIVNDNFGDALYERKKVILRKRIREIENMRVEVETRVKSAGCLTDGLFLLTGNKNIFDEKDLLLYFDDIKHCYKEYDIKDTKKLNEDDIKLINFLSIEERLNRIEFELWIEIRKIICS